MFERFTDRARDVLKAADLEARTFDHNYIGTEHVLLGLLLDEGSVGARVLASFGVSAGDVRADVDRIVGRGATETTKRRRRFTARAKRALEASLREALDRGHNYIGTEHILLGLLRAEGVAREILHARGVAIEQARTKVSVLLAERAPAARTASGESWAPVSARVIRSLSRRRAGRIVAELEKDAPACACGAHLTESARYLVVDVPERDGGDTAQVLFLFCSSCGATIDDVILPNA